MKYNCKIYLIVLFLVIGIFFSVTSVFVNYEIESSFSKSHRLANPRKFPDGSAFVIIKKFLETKRKKQFDLLIVGDSQPTGAKYPENVIFSGLILKENSSCNVLNLSFVDARIGDVSIIVEYLISNGFIFKDIIYNINQSHVNEPDKVRIDKKYINQLYLVELAKNPIEYYKVIQKELKRRSQSELLKIVKGDPGSFYLQQEKIYNLKLLSLAEKTLQLSSNVHFYYTPHAPSSMNYNGYALSLLRDFSNQLDLLLAPIGVHYYDFSEKFTDEYFRDIVHFNLMGHERMKGLLMTEARICD